MNNMLQIRLVVQTVLHLPYFLSHNLFPQPENYLGTIYIKNLVILSEKPQQAFIVTCMFVIHALYNVFTFLCICYVSPGELAFISYPGAY